MVHGRLAAGLRPDAGRHARLAFRYALIQSYAINRARPKSAIHGLIVSYSINTASCVGRALPWSALRCAFPRGQATSSLELIGQDGSKQWMIRSNSQVGQ